MITYGRQSISQSDIDAVVEVLKSPYLTQGPCVPRFESDVANYCGSAYALATSNATSALHIACCALGLGRGDLLWTSPITFVASANCALYCGAEVDFVDIDPRTFNISVDSLREKLIQAEKDGKLPKIVVPVHLCGQSCDMLEIHALSQKYGFKIIEDASHAIGGRYLERNIGGCRYSDISVFSFHPVKIITCGEGGMALTNDSDLAIRLERFRSHGISNNADEFEARPANEIWNYQQLDLGFNYRMTDIQAALGSSQLNRIEEFVSRRREIARQYDEKLSHFPLEIPWQHPDSYSSYHLYPIRIESKNVEGGQRRVYDDLRAAGIGANLHYIPVYRHPYYERLGFRAGYCEEAEKYHKEAISIPIYPSLTSDQQEYVISSLEMMFE